MAPGELQASSWAVSRCARRSFLVFFLYRFRAASKMDWKLEVELEAAEKGVWDSDIGLEAIG